MLYQANMFKLTSNDNLSLVLGGIINLLPNICKNNWKVSNELLFYNEVKYNNG